MQQCVTCPLGGAVRLFRWIKFMQGKNNLNLKWTLVLRAWIMALCCCAQHWLKWPLPGVQGLFVQDLPLKTLAALRSSQALTLKVCGCLITPWQISLSRGVTKSCRKERSWPRRQGQEPQHLNLCCPPQKDTVWATVASLLGVFL